jgi:hypothetical protein
VWDTGGLKVEVGDHGVGQAELGPTTLRTLAVGGASWTTDCSEVRK